MTDEQYNKLLKFRNKSVIDSIFSNGRHKVLLALATDDTFINYITDIQLIDTFEYQFDKLDLYIFLRQVINIYNHFKGEIFTISDFKLYSKQYTIDLDGICTDGDINSIRYKNLSDGKIYKMKASKFFHRCTENLPIPKEAIHWLAEVFAEKRKSSILDNNTNYILKVGNKLEDFYKIYKESSINSCMNDGKHISFYIDSVDASAAWLEHDGTVVARCVIFNKVYDSLGNVYRLAERQYSDKEYLKELLVLKLIKENLIDGYKKIGADVCDSRNFLDIEGNKFVNNYFSISCKLYNGSIISYQDSFKYYNDFKREAYNFNPINELNTTCLTINNVKGNFIKCPNCGKYFIKSDSFKKNGFYYCSEKCFNEAKNKFLDNNIQKIEAKKCWVYSSQMKVRIEYIGFITNEMFEYNNKIYLGHYTIIDGIKIPSEIIIEQYDINNNLLGTFLNVTDAANKTHINPSSIRKCINGTQKTTHGFIFKRKNE